MSNEKIHLQKYKTFICTSYIYNPIRKININPCFSYISFGSIVLTYIEEYGRFTPVRIKSARALKIRNYVIVLTETFLSQNFITIQALFLRVERFSVGCGKVK